MNGLQPGTVVGRETPHRKRGDSCAADKGQPILSSTQRVSKWRIQHDRVRAGDLSRCGALAKLGPSLDRLAQGTPMSQSTPGDDLTTLRSIVRRRKTTKVFGSPQSPQPLDVAVRTRCDELVRELIADAGWAPFHFDRRVDGIAEPWRVHWIKQETCRRISAELAVWFDDLKPNNKMPALLAGCGCTIVVTWLPQPAEANEDPQKLVSINEEHLAATAAYVQNLLLLLEAAGLGAYWSSGGLLKRPLAYQKLGISPTESLIACVFVDYTPGDPNRAVETAGGGQRDRRSSSERWLHDVKLT
jgi:nitroreductase